MLAAVPLLRAFIQKPKKEQMMNDYPSADSGKLLLAAGGDMNFKILVTHYFFQLFF
jgi:hypothetical protein